MFYSKITKIFFNIYIGETSFLFILVVLVVDIAFPHRKAEGKLRRFFVSVTAAYFVYAKETETEKIPILLCFKHGADTVGGKYFKQQTVRDTSV